MLISRRTETEANNILRCIGFVQTTDETQFNIIFHQTQLGLYDYVQEQLDGDTLQSHDFLLIAQGITKGLQYLHENGIVHGCLTGANVKVIF